EADKAEGGLLGRLGLLVLDHARAEDVEGPLPLPDVAPDLLPLTEPAGVVVAGKSGGQLVAPTPPGGGVVGMLLMTDKNLGEGGGDGAGLEGVEDLLGDLLDLGGVAHGGLSWGRPEGGEVHLSIVFSLPPRPFFRRLPRTKFRESARRPLSRLAAGHPSGL